MSLIVSASNTIFVEKLSFARHTPETITDEGLKETKEGNIKNLNAHLVDLPRQLEAHIVALIKEGLS